ncbi:hypothetical protein [Nonlabens dokdonensis]|nr:hypothetical protein [Nonlabens dokdonensis]
MERKNQDKKGKKTKVFDLDGIEIVKSDLYINVKVEPKGSKSKKIDFDL